MKTPIKTSFANEYRRALHHHQAGEFAKAEALYIKLLRVQSSNPEILNQLGVLYCQRGQLATGLQHLIRATKLKRTPRYLHNLALAYRELKQFDRSIATLNAILDLEPENSQVRYELAIVLQMSGRLEEALAAYRALLEMKPDFLEGYIRLANLLRCRGRLEEALQVCGNAVRRSSNCADALIEAGMALRILGRTEEALSAYRRACELKPESFVARWYLAFAVLPPMYRSVEEIEATRLAYDRNLAALERECDAASETDLRRAADVVGECAPFHLTYQGKNDRELQGRYGSLIARLMQTRYPRFAKRPPMPPLGPRRLIRVGFASAFFFRHSNWKIPIKGWVENLERKRFELYGYHLSDRRDDQTDLALGSFARFVEGRMDVERWAQLIRGDDRHVLIFPEIGMDDMPIKLAALRLAPVQATSWGHPTTSGLPSIDYFLTSDLMEPPDADNQYTERLIRLPNLSIYYAPPDTPHVTLSRGEIGLRDNELVYWCCQNLIKYLPQYDDVFPRIAERVGCCRFLFIRYGYGTKVTAMFQSRLKQAFARRDLPAEEYCAFLPKMDYGRFAAVARLANVFLDTIEWSGCNSALESLMWSIPPVVHLGHTMRGRHFAAMMTRMGITETIASSVDEYIEIAVRLGLDPHLRQATSSKIAANRHKLMQDHESVRGLEDFLAEAVRNPPPA